MSNPITWFETVGPDPQKRAAFFAELFGWHTQTAEGGYILIDTHSGRGMNGGVSEPPPDAQPGSIFYAEDVDIKAKLDEANALGAKTLMEVTEAPMVTFAVFADPWGNAIGLVQGEGETRVSTGANPAVDWVEIGCSQPEKANDFYRELFDWAIDGDPPGEGGQVHGSFRTGSEVGAQGGIGSSRDGQPHIDIYAKVDDVAKYVERVEPAGGKVVVPAMQVDDETQIAMFTDPTGNTFGLYGPVS
jgi:predicted enzyme related to lactoylglutathione lyase